MFLKDKFKLGEFERTKARLVVGGDYVTEQDAGETASPTVKPTMVMMMIKIAAAEGIYFLPWHHERLSLVRA